MCKSKKLNIVASCSLFIFIFLIGINTTFAKTTRTETLDLTTQSTEDKLNDEGWSWNNETKTLILEDANFKTSGLNPCIKFLKDDNITVIFEGINKLTSESKAVFYGDKGEHSGSITFKSSKDGILNLEITKIDDGGTNNLGNSINYANDLNFESGTINSKGGFWVDGTITISNGTVNINTEDMTYNGNVVNGIYAAVQVKITGGNVNIKSNAAAIQVTGLQGAIENVEDGVIISGGNISLSTQAANNPAIFAGNFQNKNIVINGGNITLEGDYGVYTKQGNIYVNHFDSLNANNVKNEVFKVSSDNASNKIKYAEADYSKVDEAIEKANKLNMDNYKNFNLVEQAIAAVVRGKNVLEQSEVDAMAEAINKAIDALELKNEMLSQNVENPDTSDINICLLLSLIAISGCGIVYIIKRKFN